MGRYAGNGRGPVHDSDLYITHHDIEPMPNGNILMIAREERTEEEALQAGRNPEIASDSPGGQNNVWPDHIIEVKPVGSDSADIVWRWHAWDHLIQDYDSTKDNFGVVEDHPGKIDINYMGGTGNAAGRADWMHCNGIDYNAVLDQIALSCRSMNEVYIIDHSTTTEEAAGSTGGNAGKGGDILYRWGNPQVYDKGLSSDQQLFAQHDVQWIEPDTPRQVTSLCSTTGTAGTLHTPRSTSSAPLWTTVPTSWRPTGRLGPPNRHGRGVKARPCIPDAISGAQALANGNILVTHGTQGTLYEVNQLGEIVWEYIGPIGSTGPFEQGEPVPDGNRVGSTANAIFKATHYTEAYLNATGQSIQPGAYIEPWTDACPSQDAWGGTGTVMVASTTPTATVWPTRTTVALRETTTSTLTRTGQPTPATRLLTRTAMAWLITKTAVRDTTTPLTWTSTACRTAVMT